VRENSERHRKNIDEAKPDVKCDEVSI